MKITIDKYEDCSRHIIEGAVNIQVGNHINGDLNLYYFIGDKHNTLHLNRFDKIKIELEI